MVRFSTSALCAVFCLSLVACATPEPTAGKEPARVTEGEVVTGSRLARRSEGNGQTVKVQNGRETANALRSTMENRPQSQ
jgi:hypothetical protein